MFAFMLRHLSRASLDVVTRHETFVSSLESSRDDPLLLWKIIKSTHLNTHVTKVSAVDQEEIRANYYTMRMRASETLTEYKARFDYAVDSFQEV
eukprot:scaffold8174_cov214-Ochromonas_danica.AAC.1